MQIDTPALQGPDPLVTPADIEAASGGRVTATDPRLPGLVAGVSARIRTWCGWHITPILTAALTAHGRGSG